VKETKRHEGTARLINSATSHSRSVLGTRCVRYALQ